MTHLIAMTHNDEIIVIDLHFIILVCARSTNVKLFLIENDCSINSTCMAILVQTVYKTPYSSLDTKKTLYYTKTGNCICQRHIPILRYSLIIMLLHILSSFANSIWYWHMRAEPSFFLHNSDDKYVAIMFLVCCTTCK